MRDKSCGSAQIGRREGRKVKDRRASETAGRKGGKTATNAATPGPTKPSVTQWNSGERPPLPTAHCGGRDAEPTAVSPRPFLRITAKQETPEKPTARTKQPYRGQPAVPNRAARSFLRGPFFPTLSRPSRARRGGSCPSGAPHRSAAGRGTERSWPRLPPLRGHLRALTQPRSRFSTKPPAPPRAPPGSASPGSGTEPRRPPPSRRSPGPPRAAPSEPAHARREAPAAGQRRPAPARRRPSLIAPRRCYK